MLPIWQEGKHHVLIFRNFQNIVEKKRGFLNFALRKLFKQPDLIPD